MLKFIFFIVILYFIFVAVRNLTRAVLADSHAARIEREQAHYYQPPPREAHYSYQEPTARSRPPTTVHVHREPLRSRDVRHEDVEDAKFKDL